MKQATFGRTMVVFAAVMPGVSTPVMSAPAKADPAEKARAEAAEKAEQARKDSKSESDRKAEARQHRDDNKSRRDDSKHDQSEREKPDEKEADRDRADREADKRRDNHDKAAKAQKAEAAPQPEAMPPPVPAATPAPVPVPVPQQWAISNAKAPASITAIGQAGAPDAGPPPGQSLLVGFDAPNAFGVTEFSSGTVITAAGSIGGVRAAPAGNGSVYRSLGHDSQSTFDFSGWTRGAPLASFSFEWGSIDSYNFVDFLNRRGETVWTIAGSDFPQFNGDQAAAITNQRLLVRFQREADIAAVRMRSNGAAFEFDKLTGAAATGAVPEPASWLMMIIGFGFVGHGLRRKRRRAVSA